MPKQTAADLRKQIAQHQADLQRLGSAWGQIVVDELDDADRRTIAYIREQLGTLKFRHNTAAGLKQLESIRKQLESIRVNAYARAQRKIRREAEELAGNEGKWMRRLTLSMLGFAGSGFDLTPDTVAGQMWLFEYSAGHSAETADALQPEEAVLEAEAAGTALTKGLTRPEAVKLLTNSLSGGKTWAQWWTHTADADVERIANMVNRGISEGWDIETMTAKIMGTAQNNYSDGLLSTNRAHARNLARTLCSGISNDAKDQYFRDNKDSVIGIEWLSTLDGRTCPSCAGLDGQRWENDGSFHPNAPVHPSCRCTLIPVTVLTDIGGESGKIPRANADFMAEAKRNYEAKYPGKKWEDLAYSTRKKYYWQAMREYEQRTGKPAYTIVSGKMSFREYFENMSDEQKRDWLGKERYKLLQRGNLKTDDFIPPYPERNFTVKELKERDKAAFARESPAGIIKRVKPLTREEADAVEQYTRSDDYAELNKYLRTGAKGDRYFDDMTEKLKSAISKSETTEELTVWRGIRSEVMFNEVQKGKTMPLKSFTSTSLNKNIAEQFAGNNGGSATVYKIRVPEKTKALDAFAGSAVPYQREILLPPGGNLRITEVSYERDAKGLVVRQIVEAEYGI